MGPGMQDSSARSVSGPDASSSSSTCNTEPFSLYGDIDGLEPVNQNAEENTESSSRLIIAADDTEQLLVSAEPTPCPEAENLADGMETSTVATSQNPTQHEQPSDPMSQSQDLEHQNQDGPADGREDHRMIHVKDGAAQSLCDALSHPTSQNPTVEITVAPTASGIESQNPTPKSDLNVEVNMPNDEVRMPPTRPSISLPEDIAMTHDGNAPYRGGTILSHDSEDDMRPPAPRFGSATPAPMNHLIAVNHLQQDKSLINTISAWQLRLSRKPTRTEYVELFKGMTRSRFIELHIKAYTYCSTQQTLEPQEATEKVQRRLAFMGHHLTRDENELDLTSPKRKSADSDLRSDHESDNDIDSMCASSPAGSATAEIATPETAETAQPEAAERAPPDTAEHVTSSMTSSMTETASPDGTEAQTGDNHSQREVVMLPLDDTCIELGVFHEGKYYLIVMDAHVGAKFSDDLIHFGGAYHHERPAPRIHLEISRQHSPPDPGGVWIPHEHMVKLNPNDVSRIDQREAAARGIPLQFIDVSALQLPTLTADANRHCNDAIAMQRKPHGFAQVGFGMTKSDKRYQRVLTNDDPSYGTAINAITASGMLGLARGQQVDSIAAMVWGSMLQTPHQDYKPVSRTSPKDNGGDDDSDSDSSDDSDAVSAFNDDSESDGDICEQLDDTIAGLSAAEALAAVSAFKARRNLILKRAEPDGHCGFSSFALQSADEQHQDEADGTRTAEIAEREAMPALIARLRHDTASIFEANKHGMYVWHKHLAKYLDEDQLASHREHLLSRAVGHRSVDCNTELAYESGLWMSHADIKALATKHERTVYIIDRKHGIANILPPMPKKDKINVALSSITTLPDPSKRIILQFSNNHYDALVPYLGNGKGDAKDATNTHAVRQDTVIPVHVNEHINDDEHINKELSIEELSIEEKRQVTISVKKHPTADPLAAHATQHTKSPRERPDHPSSARASTSRSSSRLEEKYHSNKSSVQAQDCSTVTITQQPRSLLQANLAVSVNGRAHTNGLSKPELPSEPSGMMLDSHSSDEGYASYGVSKLPTSLYCSEPTDRRPEQFQAGSAALTATMDDSLPFAGELGDAPPTDQPAVGIEELIVFAMEPHNAEEAAELFGTACESHPNAQSAQSAENMSIGTASTTRSTDSAEGSTETEIDLTGIPDANEFLKRSDAFFIKILNRTRTGESKLTKRQIKSLFRSMPVGRFVHINRAQLKGIKGISDVDAGDLLRKRLKTMDGLLTSDDSSSARSTTSLTHVPETSTTPMTDVQPVKLPKGYVLELVTTVNDSRSSTTPVNDSRSITAPMRFDPGTSTAAGSWMENSSQREAELHALYKRTNTELIEEKSTKKHLKRRAQPSTAEHAQPSTAEHAQPNAAESDAGLFPGMLKSNPELQELCKTANTTQDKLNVETERKPKKPKAPRTIFKPKLESAIGACMDDGENVVYPKDVNHIAITAKVDRQDVVTKVKNSQLIDGCYQFRINKWNVAATSSFIGIADMGPATEVADGPRAKIDLPVKVQSMHIAPESTSPSDDSVRVISAPQPAGSSLGLRWPTRRVRQLTPDGDFVKDFPSMLAASREVVSIAPRSRGRQGCDASGISQAARTGNKCMGYHWKFIDEEPASLTTDTAALQTSTSDTPTTTATVIVPTDPTPDSSSSKKQKLDREISLGERLVNAENLIGLNVELKDPINRIRKLEEVCGINEPEEAIPKRVKRIEEVIASWDM